MPNAVIVGASIAVGALWLAVIGGTSLAFSSHPLETFVFYVFATVVMGCSLAVALSRNIVRTATWLLGTLLGVAVLYFLMAANFLAAVQLIVYAGGILILIVFGVMLTARSPYMRGEPKRGEVVMASLVALVLFVGLASVSLAGPWPELAGAPPADQLAKIATVESIGKALLTDYLVPFEIVSVLLLAAMIGAAYLARPEHR